jgi:lipopolysaccharide export system protein LptA
MTSIPRNRIVLALALPAVLAAAPALAQVQQGNPNAANESFSNSNAIRSQQQNATTQGNISRMDNSRTVAPPPVPSAPIPPAGAPAR